MRRYISELTLLVDKKLYINGKTREDIADDAGITYQYLNNILVSRSLPSIEVTEVIASHLGEDPKRLRKLVLKCYRMRQNGIDGGRRKGKTTLSA